MSVPGIQFEMFYGFPGSGCTLTCTLRDGKIATVTIVNGGKEYPTPPTISVIPAGDDEPTVQPVLYPILTNGVVTNVNIVNPGDGFTHTPTIAVLNNSQSAAMVNSCPPEVLASLELFRLTMYGAPNGTDKDGNMLVHPQPQYPDVMSMFRGVIMSQIIQPALRAFPTTDVATAQAAMDEASAVLETTIQSSFNRPA